jgi:hypothetical protein
MIISCLFAGVVIHLASASAWKVSDLEIVSNLGKTNDKFSFDKGSISKPVEIHDRSKFSVTLKSNEDKPDYVGIMFEAQTSPGVGIVGTHPSLHVTMKPASTGSSTYKAEINFSDKRTMDPAGGEYKATVLIASSKSSSNSSKIVLGNVNISSSFSRAPSIEIIPGLKVIPELANYYPQTPIAHQFKPPHSRANPTITSVFLVLAIAVPVFTFFGGVSVLGVNMGNFTGASRITFFTGLGGFVALMGMFFAFLNFVQTCALFVILLVPLAVVGNRMLCQVRTMGALSQKVAASD